MLQWEHLSEIQKGGTQKVGQHGLKPILQKNDELRNQNDESMTKSQ